MSSDEVATPRPQPALSTAQPRPVPAKADRPAATPEDELCWVCGGPTVARQCKILCPNCGFMRDCSDP